jgi:hypothetical protein
MSKKKLGNDPFGGGDSLVRNTQKEVVAQDEQNTQVTQMTHHTTTERNKNPLGGNGAKLPRVNLALQPDALKYIHLLSGFDGVSITQYINSLILADMERRRDTYSKLLELKANSQATGAVPNQKMRPNQNAAKMRKDGTKT